MLELFLKGGPIMWPILITSITALTIVIERLFFTIAESFRRQPKTVEAMLAAVEERDFARAIEAGQASSDPVVGPIIWEPPSLCFFPFEGKPCLECLHHLTGTAHFSFVIGMTSQVTDVGIGSKEVRRWVLLHSIISFAFNTAVLALGINIASGLFAN